MPAAQRQAIERDNEAIGSTRLSSSTQNPNKISASRHHERKQNYPENPVVGPKSNGPTTKNPRF
jgi:hypothetical protein